MSPLPGRAGSLPRVTVVGDAFLDRDWTGAVHRMSPDAPVPVLDADQEMSRPGGAGLAALHAAARGAEVTLVAALGDDAEGDEVRADLARAGVTLIDLGLAGSTPVKLRLRAGGQSLARVDRNCAQIAAIGQWPDAATAAVGEAEAVLVSDYGRGMAGIPVFGVLVQQLHDRVPVVWDPHPRGVRPPAGGLDVMTPNLDEARTLSELGGQGEEARPGGGRVLDALRLAEHASALYDCAVAVTAGDRGAAFAEPGREPVLLPVEAVSGDVCGAGDRFAATVAVERAGGSPRVRAVQHAVEQARRHVAGDLGDGTASPPHRLPSLTRDALALAREVRDGGGVVVAAGGCFDVVHAGHVHLLESARRLGDCLVVCLNSDRSVRRLKGPPRPIHPLADRIRVLQGLSCVDAVLAFDGDTPCEALQAIRPHLFVKGADYRDRHLPEREVLAGWDGRVVLLPVLEGRSTTGILQAAAG